MLIAVVMAIASLGYYGLSRNEPDHREGESIGLSQEQEVVLALQSAPQMAQESVRLMNAAQRVIPSDSSACRG